MNAKINLKQTERNTFKLATYSDGITDISLGLVMILMGVYPFTRELLGLTGNMIFSLVVLGLIFSGQVWAKKHLAPSRIGLVKLGPQTQKRLKTVLLIGILLLLLTTGSWVLSSRGYGLPDPPWLGSYGLDILVAVVVLLIFSGVAYTLEMARYYLYGILLGVTFPLQNLLPGYRGTPYFISGAVIIGIGALLLVRFLNHYPAVDEDNWWGEGA